MVVIVFRSRIRQDADMSALETMGNRMFELASRMPGFVDYKDFTAADGEFLSLVHFEDEATLLAWRNQPEHAEVQEAGRREFFSDYHIEICSTIREYAFSLNGGRKVLR